MRGIFFTYIYLLRFWSQRDIIGIMAEPKIIYEDKNFLVLNKPAGLVMHPVANSRAYRQAGKLRIANSEKTLADWLLKNYPEVGNVGDNPLERPGIVHRLDKETSGIILAARNQETFEYLKGLFQNHKVEKRYLALAAGKVKDKNGIINKPLGIKSGTTKRSVFSEKMAKEAVTEYQVIKYLKIKDKDFTLLEVIPKTGRTHQIRAHLAYIGYPVAGDKLYGGKKSELDGLNRQFLHAKSIEFTAPDGSRMKFEAELPDDLQNFLQS